VGRNLTVELRKGKQRYKEEEFISAAKHFNKVLETDPEHIEAQLLLGAIKLEISDQIGYSSGDIAGELREIIGIEDYYGVEPKFRRGSAFAYLLLGMFHDLQNKHKEAVKNYDKVIRFEEENALWSEASDWARKFKAKRCQDLPPHKKMVELLL
jgi:tetratricopeptide (TPR) repeat protein